ncbi:WxL domain-containing protein [Lactobacillus sp. CBA3605]|uniref:WxL domain-containing protein n=1 Tax=Lactobacillus sp. CBA3605 TaxID=2099788 RepID=UPI000CFBD064|nr:WxL domain-containing protein [Lactobacillus sp. CBA3605]AVK61210.1 WxL domain-containing protein [Lactobacillus sp. CBA3605]
MKKTLLGLMLSISLLAGMAVTANAADETQSSTGDVTFESGSITIDNGGSSSTTANLDFGSHKIGTDDTAPYTNTNDSAQVSVQDQRGTAAGWDLSVAQDTQFISKMTNKTLTGAVITLVGTLDATSSSTGADATVNGTVALTPGGTTTSLMTAAAGKGNGTSVADLTKSTLDVPTSTARVAEAYSTTLTWQLSNTPSNS